MPTSVVYLLGTSVVNVEKKGRRILVDSKSK